MQKPYSKDVVSYELYADSPWQRAKELVDLFGDVHAPHVDKNTIKAETVIKNAESVVFINARTLVRIYNLPRIRDSNILDIISPVYRKGYFADCEIYVMPADLQLINIYRHLYRPYPPTTHTSYTDLLRYESMLFSYLDFGAGDTVDTVNTVNGGVADSVDSIIDDTDNETVLRESDREVDINTLIEGGCEDGGCRCMNGGCECVKGGCECAKDECRCMTGGCECMKGGCECMKGGCECMKGGCCDDDVPLGEDGEPIVDAVDAINESIFGGSECQCKPLEYSGGRKHDRHNQHDKPTRHVATSRLERIIIDEVIRNSDMLLIGDHAANVGINSNMRLQVVATDDISGYVAKIHAALSAAGIKSRIEYTKYALQIPNDFQTYKYTVYTRDQQDKRTALLDIFNSTSFELVPFGVSRSGELSNIMIAGAFVVLRFKLIDLYSMKFVSKLGGGVSGRVADIKKQINVVRQRVLSAIADDPLSVFQLENHAGKFLDESVEKRNTLGKERFRFAPYYFATRGTAASE